MLRSSASGFKISLCLARFPANKAKTSGLLVQPISCTFLSLIKAFQDRKRSRVPVEVRNAEKVDVESEMKKIKEMNARELNSNVNTINPHLDEFIDKEDYLSKIHQRRLNEEKEFEDRKKKHDYAQQRLKREHEVIMKGIDYSNILLENINIGPSAAFASLEELLLFIHSLRGKMTEENFFKCLEGFIFFGDHMNENDLLNPSYVKFIDLCPFQIPIINDPETLVMLAKFLDLYCIERDDLWIACEQKIMMFMMDKLKTESLADIIVCFGNQAEGTEKMFDKFEVRLLPVIPKTMDLAFLTKIILGFYNRKVGTQEFFQVLFMRLRELLEEKDGCVITEKNIKDIARLALIIRDISDKLAGFTEEFYRNAEKVIMKVCPEVEFEHACVLGEGFGFENGSQEFIEHLEKSVVRRAMENGGKLEDFSQVRGLLNGFILNYRASKETIELAKKCALSFKGLLSPVERANLVKAMWIMEVEDLEFFQEIEQTIVVDIKENSIDFTNNELFEIAVAFCVTRNGTRELYRLLEIVLTPRLKEMGKEDPELLKKFHGVYSQSGMCTATFITNMEEFMMFRTK